MTTGKSYTESQGSLGFFQYLADLGDSDAAAAVAVLNDGKLDNYLHLGGANDATSLDNMKEALTIIDNCNMYRKQEGRAPLKVSSRLMAISQKHTNCSAQTIEHSRAYSVGENLSWGYFDPFDGWYHREKKVYDEKGSGETGHYRNIVNSSYGATGVAFISKGRTSGQVFDYGSYGMDAASYRAKFEQYYKEVKGNGSAAAPDTPNQGNPSNNNGSNPLPGSAGKVYSYETIPSCGILVRTGQMVIIQGSPFENQTSFDAAILLEDDGLTMQLIFGSIPQELLDAEKKYGKLVDYTDEEDTSQKPEQKPNDTQKPAPSQKPDDTKKPDSSQKPDNTQKPENNQEPADPKPDRPIQSSVSLKIDHALNKGEFSWNQGSDGSWSVSANGKTLKHTTAQIEGKVYHFDGSGKMVKGFYKEDGETYRFSTSGDLKFGWMKVNDLWYYADKSGALQDGWIKDPSGKWYFMNYDFDGDPNALAMLTGYLAYNGDNYFLDSSGAMKTGWLNMAGYSNYFYTAADAKKYGVKEGTMALNTTIDGYPIDEYGYWYNPDFNIWNWIF